MGYLVSIDGPGLQVRQEVDAAVIPRFMALLFGTAAPSLPQAAPATAAHKDGSSIEPSAGESPREFIRRTGATNNVGKVVALGLFVSGTQQKEFFTAEELRQAFVAAGEPVPSNLPRDLKLTLRSGWIAKSPASKADWYVTSSGRAAASDGFQGNGRRPKQGRRRKAQDPPPASSKNRAGGASKVLEYLITEGFFSEPQTTQRILDIAAQKGRNLQRTDLTQPLLTFVQTGRLKRRKVAGGDGGREVWGYFA